MRCEQTRGQLPCTFNALDPRAGCRGLNPSQSSNARGCARSEVNAVRLDVPGRRTTLPLLLRLFWVNGGVQEGEGCASGCRERGRVSERTGRAGTKTGRRTVGVCVCAGDSQVRAGAVATGAKVRERERESEVEQGDAVPPSSSTPLDHSPSSFRAILHGKRSRLSP